MRSAQESGECVPLCVDLDGTLITSNILLQELIEFLRISPLNLFAVLGWLLRGRALLKERVGECVALNVAQLPYREDLLAHLRAEYARGRPLVLCTAANEQVAVRVADHLGIFSGVLSSNRQENLKGRAKSKALERRFGTGQFDYAGDSWADLAVWRRARSVIVVNARPWTHLALRLLNVRIALRFPGMEASR
jgi:phosphoserine phosphatase